MRYYLKITLLVDEPIQFTVFSDYGRRDAECSLIFENQAFFIDVNEHMLDYFKPEHIGTHLGIAVDVAFDDAELYEEIELSNKTEYIKNHIIGAYAIMGNESKHLRVF